MSPAKPSCESPRPVNRTFGFIKYGTTTRSFIDIVIEDCQFFIELTAGEKVAVSAPGRDILSSERSAA